MERGAVVLALCALLLLGACDSGRAVVEATETVQPKPLAQILDENADMLLRLPGVVGVGIGDCSGTLCIRVFVREKTPGVVAGIPRNLDGYEVDIEETGEITPRSPGP